MQYQARTSNSMSESGCRKKLLGSLAPPKSRPGRDPPTTSFAPAPAYASISADLPVQPARDHRSPSSIRAEKIVGTAQSARNGTRKALTELCFGIGSVRESRKSKQKPIYLSPASTSTMASEYRARRGKRDPNHEHATIEGSHRHDETRAKIESLLHKQLTERKIVQEQVLGDVR